MQLKESMKLVKVFLLLISTLFFAAGSNAAPVNADTAAATVRGWLQTDPTPLGDHLGSAIGTVDTYRDTSGLPLYHVVNLKPSGFVIVSGDDQVEPIIAFVSHGHYDPSPNNTLGALIGKDLPARMARVRGKGFKPGTAELKAQGKWQELGASGSGGAKPAVVMPATGTEKVLEVWPGVKVRVPQVMV